MKNRLKKMCTVIAVLGLLVLTVVCGAGLLIRLGAKGRTYSDAAAIPQREVGLLLGCAQVLADGRQNLFFAYRIEAAAQLFKAQKIKSIIVSGDNHAVGYDEPTDMKNALIAAGVPAERIYCDYAGFRTLDSVVRAQAIFGQTNITVISQRFHNQRAIYIARHRGMDAIGFNAREVNVRNSIRTTLREQFARVKTILDIALGVRPKFLGPPVEISREQT